ncbi:hypothetical protein VTN77DRAFT_1280 [Rasamsonia byssochlamydoides]|uniref:uncharacterized protein n=1 Tax=Rasamsonia byssochlamydoides TaxID=89139 RepID=UPI00374480F4
MSWMCSIPLMKDQRPLYGELSQIIRIMDHRVEKSQFRAHQTMPVLMVSFIGYQHGRIIHAHQNRDRKLVLQYSPPYSFERKKTALFKPFYRVMLSNAVGDTKVT